MTEQVQYASEIIPQMTHPFGKHWRQPDLSEILIGEEDVVMSRHSFDKLSDYSMSRPSGVYEGKMWRSTNVKNGITSYTLYWWDNSPKADHVTLEARNILIIEK